MTATRSRWLAVLSPWGEADIKVGYYRTEDQAWAAEAAGRATVEAQAANPTERERLQNASWGVIEVTRR